MRRQSTVPADGQLSVACYRLSHQEAVTSAVWGRPSLEGDKTWQSLNAPVKRSKTVAWRSTMMQRVPRVRKDKINGKLRFRAKGQIKLVRG